MKLYWSKSEPRINVFFALAFLLILSSSCATYTSQFGKREPVTIKDNFNTAADISHTIYLIGDAGDTDVSKISPLFKTLSDRLKKADSASTLIFLGDNVYPLGMPSKDDSSRTMAEEKLNNQLQLSKNFKGKTIFIPGNHDWYSGIDGLRDEAKIVNNYSKGKTSFLPKMNCGIDEVNINPNVALIVIDSQWYLEDWDKHPTINEDCEIKTREQFFDALQNKINENQNKTIVIAIHHPLMTNGSHGGEFSLYAQLFPLPVPVPLPGIGTVMNLVRKTSGIISQDLHNKKYSAFANRIKTLIRDKQNIVVVSGHDHALQYIDGDGIKQIVSGSGSKQDAARAINANDFSIGKPGFATLQILKSGATKVSYFGNDSKGNEALLFNQQPIPARKKPNLREFPLKFVSEKDTSVYTTKMSTRSKAYRLLWGDHYRKYYGTPVKVQQVSLDTLYGGLKPTIAGNDSQAQSLRLEDRYGREYEMRGLRRSATRFLQNVAFKDQSVENDFRDTYTEEFIMDFYTSAHPFTAFAAAELAKRVGVNHTNPALFYVPKQNSLELFNQNYGGALYMVEERPTTEFKNLYSFGKPSKILSTEEVLDNLKADPKYIIDEDEYMKARMFDMLIGDWDANADQWRWGEFKEKGKVVYRPIPVDRNQAFSKYDGPVFKFIMNFQEFRHMAGFGPDIKSVKWFNSRGYNLDQRLIKKATKEDWMKQAELVQKNLTDAEIDRAFTRIPIEVRDETIDKIKRDLKSRKSQLQKYAAEYYNVLQKTVLVVGTEKRDKFEITRKGPRTLVKVYQVENGKETLLSDREFLARETNELWIYGLGGEDVYKVSGSGRKPKIRLLGGPDKDSYEVPDAKKVRIYDFKSKENNVGLAAKSALRLSDSYDVNTYNYEKAKYNFFAGTPIIGYNPDDGLQLGGLYGYTIQGFNNFPFSQKHSVGGTFFFATQGYELIYRGVFPRIYNKWDLNVDAIYTSPNFAVNFFGFGNESPNVEDQKGMEYNRVKISTTRFAPSLQWVGEQGSAAIIEASFESKKVDPTDDRFITENPITGKNLFYSKNFADVNARYSFTNYDNVSYPTLGMTFYVLGGYKVNINDLNRQFPYAESGLGFTYKLSKSGLWVLATYLKGRALFNDEYEFYHGATVGGDLDLRGYRNERFAGRQSFFQTTDVRYNLGKLKNGIIPIRYGIFGGADYGRVWLPQEVSDKWHQSVGGGLWLNGVNLITAKVSYFYSTDGDRVAFALGLNF